MTAPWRLPSRPRARRHRRHPLANRSTNFWSSFGVCPGLPPVRPRSRAASLPPAEPQHVEIRHRGLAPRKMLQYMAAAVAAQGFPAVARPRRDAKPPAPVRDGIFRLDADSRLGLLKNLARLTFHPENHRPGARHELQHLAGNHSLEYFGLLEQNQAHVRRANIGRYLLPRLLIYKTQVGKTAGPRPAKPVAPFPHLPPPAGRGLWGATFCNCAAASISVCKP